MHETVRVIGAWDFDNLGRVRHTSDTVQHRLVHPARNSQAIGLKLVVLSLAFTGGFDYLVFSSKFAPVPVGHVDVGGDFRPCFGKQNRIEWCVYVL